ncbi:MAG: DUF4398 domain-containing protein [Thermodesulfobacteriota bacterium]|nr:DUF4398 domain-containing protein [Thermodesulfobacteriota bacterium]
MYFLTRYFLLAFVALVVLASCSEPPRKEIAEADRAYKAALNAQAEIYAKEELGSARKALERVQAEIREERYKEAREAALLARTRAEAALKAAEENKAKVKAQAEKVLAELKLNLDKTRKMLAGASNLRDKDRDRFNYRLEDIDLALSESDFQIKRGGYPVVLEESQRLSSALLGLEKEIEPAIKKASVPDIKAKKKKRLKK